MQRLVERRELVAIDAADLLDRSHVLLIERFDSVAHLASLVGQPDAHRTTINPRTLMVEKAHLNQLLQIVGDIGSEIIAARAQFAGGKFLVADVVQQQRLYRVDVGAAPAVELVLDDVEQPAVQPLDQCQGFEIERPDLPEPRLPLGRFNAFGNAFHGNASPYVVASDEALFPPSWRHGYPRRSKFDLNNTIKIKFICHGE